MTDNATDDAALFYKYTSAETAIKILESSTFRYSSPLLFNDPFDIQTGLHFDFDIQQLPEKIFERAERLVLQPEPPTFLDGSTMAEVINLMREKLPTHGFPRDRARLLMMPALSFLVSQLSVTQQQIQNKWRYDFLPRLRVFSVSRNRDNLLMWAHYARDHTGAVFELRAIPEVDNPVGVARPVQYCRVPPPLFSEAQWIEFMIERADLREQQYFMQYAYMKSDIWAYENEWRVWTLEQSVEPPHYTAWPIFPKEIEAIYLGCKIDPDKKNEIKKLVAEKQPHAKLFQACKARDEYKIEFDAV